MEKMESLEAKILKTCSAEGDTLVQVEAARKFTLALPCDPNIIQNKLLTPTDLLTATQTTDSDFICNVFLPAIVREAQKEGVPGAATSDEEGLPGQTLLKHAFFQLKTAEDAWSKAKATNEAVQKKYATAKGSFDKRTARKRKAAAVECDRIIAPDAELKERKLARRNQINRKRKNITKIRKERSEEHCPEAGYRRLLYNN